MAGAAARRPGPPPPGSRSSGSCYGPGCTTSPPQPGCCAPRRARPQPLLVEPWARAYGLIPGPGSSPHTVSLIGPGPGFDPEYAMGTDLDEPVIIATLTSPAGEAAGPLLVDGCHRLYKAAQLGSEHVPSLVLTAAETLAIRRDAVIGPARRPGGTESRS